MDLKGKVIRISPSAATLFMDCGVAYRKKYIEGRVTKDKKDSEAISFGSALHRTTEGFNPKIWEEIHEEKTGTPPNKEIHDKAEEHFWKTLPAKVHPVYKDLQRILPQESKKEVFIYMPFPKAEVAGAKWIMECHIDMVWNNWLNCGDLKTSTKKPEVALPSLMKGPQSYMYLWAIGTGNFSYLYAQRPTINIKKGETNQDFHDRCMLWLEENGKTAQKIDLQYTKQQVEIYLLELQAKMVHAFKHDIFSPGPACRKWYSPCDYYDDCFKETPLEKNYNENGFDTDQSRIKITNDHWCLDYLGQEIPDTKNYRKKNDYRELYKDFYDPPKEEEVIDVKVEKEEEKEEEKENDLLSLVDEPKEGILDVLSTPLLWEELFEKESEENKKNFLTAFAKKLDLTSLAKVKNLIKKVVNELITGKIKLEKNEVPKLPWVLKWEKKDVLTSIRKSDETYITNSELKDEFFSFVIYKTLKGEL